MILTQCAVCATELGLSLGKKCGRCSTRYCGAECQKQHWEQGGHDQLCKKIKKSGGAEQYNANKKYTEAVAVAAEACAEDTKGQTCYICTQAVHWKTKEGLVRGCSCRGTAGFAHVSCLAEEAKILLTEAEENNLTDKVLNERWHRWQKCSLCEQNYHGVVACAMGWACWKTSLGQPETERFRSHALSALGTTWAGFGVFFDAKYHTDWLRQGAMNILGSGLINAMHYADALSVCEAQLAMLRRIGAGEDIILRTQSNIADIYSKLGQPDRALQLEQDIYSGNLKLHGGQKIETLQAANNYAWGLVGASRFEEARSLLRKTMPVARRVVGENHHTTRKMRWAYARSLCLDTGATLDDLREAVTTLEDTERTARRVFGDTHPLTEGIEGDLERSRAVLRAREAQSPGDLCEALGAI